MTIWRSMRITFSVAVASMSIVLGLTSAALGQLEPDETLGEERSQVREISPVDFDIEGGARRGNNLFHSFREFNVSEGGSVYFVTPDGIQNILSRVTGGNPSNILGRLGVFGNANLFLINPNGIVFGPNASLDVQGSFAATTADGIQFGEQGFFSATNPETPGLLTVNPSALFFNQLNPAPIRNNSIAFAGQSPSGANVFGLRVPDGQSLMLVGGNITLDGEEFGGRLNAFGGRVELGGLSEPGAVLLNADGSLGFPDGVGRSDVSLNNGIIDVAAGGGGSIAINARNIDISDRSLLRSGIAPTLGTVDSQAGNIILNGTREIQVGQSSFITNNVEADGIGNSGNIDITVGSLFVTDGVSLQAFTRGQGNAGNIVINARDQVMLDGSSAFSTVAAGGVGSGGNVEIVTGSLEVLNGTALVASTDGRGNAGNVIINVRDRVVFDDSSAFSTVEASGVGSGGGIEIDTNALEVHNQAELVASTRGQGNAGNVIINARDRVVFDDSDAFSSVESTGIGIGGNIEINTETFEILNTAQLVASTTGQGNAGNVIINAHDQVVFDDSDAISRVEEGGIGIGGNINIDTDSLEVRSGAQLVASTEGRGDAGNVIINAYDRVVFDGTSADGELSSAAFSRVNRTGIGNGGNVEINTGTLEVRNGARLQVSTLGRGDAGNVIVNAYDRVVFDGTSADGEVPSFAFSRVNENGVGNGGNVEIDTGTLEVGNGAQLAASTDGQGNAGNVLINARDQVVFDGSAVFSNVDESGVGNGGNIEIDTNSLEVRNTAQLIASTNGQGNAGNVIVNARDQVVFDGISADGELASGAFSRVEESGIGNAGDVRITTNSLLLSNGAELQARTFGRGNAGDVIINARDWVSFNDANARSSVDPNAVGNGGNVEINTRTLEVLNTAQLIAATSGRGNAGNVIVNARDQVVFDGTSAAFSNLESSTAIGNGGNVEINTGTLEVLNGTELIAISMGQGNAGNVIINARDRVVFDDSAAFSRVEGTGIGRGGNVEINTDSLEVLNGAQLVANTLGRGDAGNVMINAASRVVFDDSNAFSTVEQRGRGEGGNIEITAPILEVLDGAQLAASTNGQGNAGNVVISATDRVTFNGGVAFSAVEQRGRGEGGNIEITTPILEVLDGAQLQASTNGRGNAGNVFIMATGILVNGVGSSGFPSGVFTSTGSNATGRGGRVTVTTPNLRLANGAVINAQTANNRPGGSVVIEADQFTALNGGQVITSTLSSGRAGTITVNANRITISGVDPTYEQRLRQNSRAVANQGANSGLFANTDIGSTGDGGRITVNSNNLTLENGARISAQSQGTGTAGDIRLNVSEQLQLTDSDIVTNAPRSSGGDITVNNSESSGLILLRGDSDITTNSQGNGGNITLQGSGIIAFDDSDILARSQDARGGNITLAPFFSANPAFESEAPFDGNGRVDVNADGSIAAGTITTPDTSVIQNSLTDLPESAIDTDNLVANSCVVRSQEQSGTFIIAGAEGLPQRPGDAPLPTYPTGEVQSTEESSGEPTWQMGDPIVEPQGMYRLQDGRMVLSRECN